MLWGQCKVYTDNKIFVQDALGLTSDGVYWWRLLEEYGLEIIHIKDIHNTVADAILYIDYIPVESTRETWMIFTQCWCYYATNNTAQQLAIRYDSMNLVFANCSEEDLIYPLRVREIMEAQKADPTIKTLTSDQKYTTQLVENTQVLCKGTAMVLPTALRH